MIWKIRSARDVQALWDSVRKVPWRTDGRKHYHEERYCLGVYLMALATHEFLTFPFEVEEGESPDFILTLQSGETVGIEITRATENWLQREMTASEREYRRRQVAAAACGQEPEPVVTSLSETGWAADEVEERWCELVRRAIEAKVVKLPDFRPASRHDLVVYDDTPLPGIDKQKALSSLAPWCSDLKKGIAKLGCISAIVSRDVLFDVGGKSRVLPYAQWSALESAGRRDP